MGPDPNAPPPPPGSLTVPPLHGWVVLLVLLGLVIVVAVCFLLIGASTPSDSRSAEWRSWLDARSRAGSIADSDPAATRSAPPGDRSPHGAGGRSGTPIRR
ncbi:hypothetical protein [Blastococcus goldschmidtiae]|uniref:Uncharacterized protein n=1 Tax=Blastococcus goldschmidtiae TaxID=3075546 RepID=A0ABU2K5F2_9ACTN|nr:hypothetical protein [Blastococcus sp. DSM 46792]MDT0275424.1 hypothetical protein [Blastococcus sp. DSM 46792]